jgi:preprotein translocase SecE subunit
VPGARAGAFVGAFLVFLALLITIGIGNSWLIGNPRSPNMDPAVALACTGVVGAALLFIIGWMFVKPGFGRWLVRIEENGWFHAIAFKPNQGLRVRRGTLIGLIIVGVCGIITLLQHRTLSAGAWTLDIPGTNLMIPLMFGVNMTMPVVLGILLVWVAWRIVNWPAFADFLIATEAEVNKVSWTTRKRLVQDTIVVLVTVFLMTLFLFLVDVFWIRALNVVGVLSIDTQELRAKQQEAQSW